METQLFGNTQSQSPRNRTNRSLQRNLPEFSKATRHMKLRNSEETRPWCVCVCVCVNDDTNLAFSIIKAVIEMLQHQREAIAKLGLGIGDVVVNHGVRWRHPQLCHVLIRHHWAGGQRKLNKLVWVSPPPPPPTSQAMFCFSSLHGKGLSCCYYCCEKGKKGNDFHTRLYASFIGWVEGQGVW